MASHQLRVDSKKRPAHGLREGERIVPIEFGVGGDIHTGCGKFLAHTALAEPTGGDDRRIRAERVEPQIIVENATYAARLVAVGDVEILVAPVLK